MKLTESMIRYRLRRQGMLLRKSRARSYSVDNQLGYMIVDAHTNAVLGGERFDMEIGDVEEWAKGDARM